MRRFLLDTNVVSELRKPKPHGAVIAWWHSLSESQIFVSAVTLGELQAGIERTRRHDAAKAGEIELWVDQLQAKTQILVMDSSCFREWARLMAGKSLQLAQDGMIAATARVHSLVVATPNETDFHHFGVPVLNPFQP